MYDYIIIGGGIAGLYINFLLAKNNKTLLLEKNNYLGGRALDIKFHNEYIKLGAGIGALHNKHLLKLLNILKIKTQSFNSNVNIISDEITKTKLIDMIKQIKDKYKSLSFTTIKNLSSKEFIIKYFGKDFFDLYSKYTEYQDWFESSIESYIKYYPITDHIPSKYTIVYINWMELINKLTNYINKYNKIIKNYTVNHIKYVIDKKIYIINNKYETKNIIFAITINNLTKLTKTLPIKINYSDYIGYIPFIRIYTYHKNGHKLNIDRYNIVNNRLQKIIIMSDKILMISYSDNFNALYWKKYMDDKNKIIDLIKQNIKKLLNIDIQIDDIYIKYWDEGIHYYKPNGLSVDETIKKLNNPLPNMYVCGEMLSKKQGWVEGSIQSVDNIIKLIKSK